MFLSQDSYVIKKGLEDATWKKYRLQKAQHSNEYGGALFVMIPYVDMSRSPISINSWRVRPEGDCVLSNEHSTENKRLLLWPSISKDDYLRKIHELKKEIQHGNVYEVNFCMEFSCDDADIDPLVIFHRLYELTKAPYASLAKLDDDFIISASPELFLLRKGNLLITKPIKGTAKRGQTPEEDAQFKQQLYESVKERTENVMAVDVARNDLSMLAKRGTVKVNKLYNIETYETVHQMVSTVSCELNEDASFEQILSASFPMASMTGAPKKSAMQLIDQLEGFDRNYYSGAMGWIKENGDFELSVNIRSIFYNQRTKHLSIAVGSAITHLCDPEQEYDECLLKAKALLEALNATIEN